MDCETWDCKNAASYVTDIRKKMDKPTEGGQKKKQKTVSFGDEESDPKAATKAKGDEGNDVTPSYSCALCGETCATNDRVGKSKSEEIVPGTAVFHKVCRSKIFGSSWWATIRPMIKKKKINANKQWQFILAKANACRCGVDALTPKAVPLADESVPILADIEGLAAEATLTGNDLVSGLYSGMAKLLQKNSGEATASDAVLREFGLKRLLWDKIDLAIENAKRRRGGRSDELVKKAEIKRDCFLWDLIESCSQDLTGTVDRTEWIDDTEKTKNTYDSRRRRECFVYAILEGMCRLIASMDAEKLKKNTQGKELIDLAESAFEVARESQERVYWVADGTFSWAAIEGSENLHLTDEMLRAYKGGAKLNREKLFKLMRRKRIEYMTKFMKTDGASSSNKNSSKELSKLKTELSKLKRKMGTKIDSNKRGVFDKFCKWCKRAERPGTHTHDSDDCHFRFPDKKGKKRRIRLKRN